MAKNSRSLRITTLKLVEALFDPLVYRKVDDLPDEEADNVRAEKDRELIKEHYSHKCNIVDLLSQFE